MPNRWDLVALPLTLGLLALLAEGARQMAVPFTLGQEMHITLDPAILPWYAVRTTLRMLVALAASLLFSICYATLAAKNRRAGLILVPMLDVLQSVPVLGYISFTVTGFIALIPGSLLGVEAAAIFAIFTSQAWNITFSLYQALRTVPHDLREAATVFRLTSWQRFWRLELPFALPGLIWNAMVSMSGGWFFVIASEAITVGNAQITLPGVGSYIALAVSQQNLRAVGYAVLTMLVVIVLYDQFMFRPLVAWSNRFRSDQSPSDLAPQSWALRVYQRARLLRIVVRPLMRIFTLGLKARLPERTWMVRAAPRWSVPTPVLDWSWYGLLGVTATALVVWAALHVHGALGWPEVARVVLLGLVTAVRVVLLTCLAALIWVPVGVFVGLRPRLAEQVQPLAQFLAAFPANVVFPFVVPLILTYRLNPDIWLSPLLILGAQWYILFNVIAGASVFPVELRDAWASLNVRGLLWWTRLILPGVFPYLLTGAITASGGAWNASIVAEIVNWGDTTVAATGLGTYVAQATRAGDYDRIALGVGVMVVYVIVLNRLLWRPLYALTERRLRLD
ncbi:MAG TPA: ABC transporter permease subunit [bacterium]|nr:ABC transporter permease subunit [bacterium]